MPDTQPALGAEDFDYLVNLSVGSMDGKKQADALIAKMTPQEKSAFYQYVNANRRAPNADNRVDNNIATGVPLVGSVSPADPVVGLGIANAVKSAVVDGGAGLLGRTVAGAKELVSQAHPIVKYEAVKATLTRMGMPPDMATVVAMAASGYRQGGKATAAEAPAAVPEAPYGPASIRPSQMSPAQIEDAVFNGANANVPKVQRGLGGRPVKPVSAAPTADVPPASAPAVPAPPAAEVVGTPAPAPTPVAPPAAPSAAPPDPAAVGRMTLTAPEAAELIRLTKSGKTMRQALELIQAQRDFQARFGLSTPSVAETKFPKGMRGGSQPLAPLK